MAEGELLPGLGATAAELGDPVSMARVLALLPASSALGSRPHPITPPSQSPSSAASTLARGWPAHPRRSRAAAHAEAEGPTQARLEGQEAGIPFTQSMCHPTETEACPLPWPHLGLWCSRAAWGAHQLGLLPAHGRALLLRFAAGVQGSCHHRKSRFGARGTEEGGDVPLASRHREQAGGSVLSERQPRPGLRLGPGSHPGLARDGNRPQCTPPLDNAARPSQAPAGQCRPQLSSDPRLQGSGRQAADGGLLCLPCNSSRCTNGLGSARGWLLVSLWWGWVPGTGPCCAMQSFFFGFCFGPAIAWPATPFPAGFFGSGEGIGLGQSSPSGTENPHLHFLQPSGACQSRNSFPNRDYMPGELHGGHARELRGRSAPRRRAGGCRGVAPAPAAGLRQLRPLSSGTGRACRDRRG